MVCCTPHRSGVNPEPKGYIGSGDHMIPELITMGFSFAGGVALFLLGMKLLTDGLKVAAGESLRNVLAKYTSTAPKGILTGILITGLVQSSSAVIFATIGFVNAGLMALIQAAYVILGSNVGTTFTGWIIAGIGLKVNLKVLAMPFLAAGMVLWLTSASAKRGAWGQALAGFGLFFLGIDVLKTTFEGVGSMVPLDAIGSGWAGRISMVIAGMILTTVMQSSSATIAVVITAVAGGVVPVYAAAALVIGADIGTTSTAAFAVIGATSNAKRTASVHVVFNVVTGLVVFLFAGWYLDLIGWISGGTWSVAITIALFHTLKKITGIILVLPFTHLMVHKLEGYFLDPDSIQEKPRYLDDTVLQTPSLAVSALIFELKRVGRKTRKLVRSSIKKGKTVPQLMKRLQTVDTLNLHVAEFIQKMQPSGLSEDLHHVLPQALRVLQYFREAADHALEAAGTNLSARTTPLIREAIYVLQHQLDVVCTLTESEKKGFSIRRVNRQKKLLEKAYDDAKVTLLNASSGSEITIQRMLDLHELIRNYRRISDQLVKAAHVMDHFNTLIDHIPGTGPELKEVELEHEVTP